MQRVLLLLCLVASAGALAADVECPAEAPSQRTVEFRELWRTDPDDPDYLLGNIGDVVLGADGAIYMLDVQQQEVYAFDASGRYQAVLARKGEGPGEIQNVWNMSFWAPDRLLLPQGFPARVVCVNSAGDPLPELRILRTPDAESPAGVSNIVTCGEYAVVSGYNFVFSPEGSSSERWIGIIDAAGALVHELGSKTMEQGSDPLHQTYDELAEFWPFDRWTASAAGRIYAAPEREQYRIDVYDANGERLYSIRRPMEARKRSDDEIDEMKDSRSFVFNGQKAEIDYKISPLAPPINGMRVVDGDLWVSLDSADQGFFRRVAVHDTDGKLLEELTLEIPYDQELDRVEMLSDGRIVVIENAVSAQKAQFAAFGGDDDGEDDAELEAEPVVVVIYEMVEP